MKIAIKTEKRSIATVLKGSLHSQKIISHVQQQQQQQKPFIIRFSDTTLMNTIKKSIYLHHN
uniref:Uncharacterized protein n=1 Tax=Glossina brevipalpis TaxID=37001 RepID=A0A1A9X4K5_9MUSC